MTTDPVPAETEAGGTLAYNVMHFVRGLRGAGLPAGPGKTIAAVRAVEAVDPARRSDLYWALHAVLVERRDQHDIFDQAFHLFWREIRLQSTVQGPVMASDRLPQPEAPPASRRASEAIAPRLPDEEENQENVEIELDAVLTFSPQEVLQEMDFEDMSADELAEAKRAIAALRLPIKPVPTRRFRPRSAWPADRHAGHASREPAVERRPHAAQAPLPRRAPADAGRAVRRIGVDEPLLAHVPALRPRRDQRPRPGAQLPLRHAAHQHHALSQAPRRRCRRRQREPRRPRLVRRHADRPCLKDFNQLLVEARAGPGRAGAADHRRAGRDDLGILRAEVERLHKSCRRLIWLNPLLRYEGFKPEAGGVRTILPHIDDFRPVHNIASLMDIAPR